MKLKYLIFSILVFTLACSAGFRHVVVKQHFKLSQFVSADTCGGCHSEIYKQWKGSMHQQAHHDPVYNSVAKYYLKGLTKKGEIDESESCVKCHTPIGVTTGFPTKTSDDLTKTADIAKNGIQCDYCHSSVSAHKMYNNGLIKKPGQGDENPGIKYGPFKDSKSDYHKTAYSEFHTSSEICGTCHNVRHVFYGTWLETTYEEWKKSPYNSMIAKNRVTCQGCHMYQRPGHPATGSTKRDANPGTASDGSKKRPHIFTHYFVGANSAIPEINKDETKKKMAIARLQNAAELSISTSNISKGIVNITVKNTGAGHKLPTGLTDTRQMWLQILIKDVKEKVLHRSGFLDRKGNIEKNTIIYNTVFGDAAGKPIQNISKAVKIIKDYRIEPGKSVTESIKLTSKPVRKYFVSVKLLYRSAPQHIINIAMGAKRITLPIVEMESLKKQLDIK
jgi:hypothetical protein